MGLRSLISSAASAAADAAALALHDATGGDAGVKAARREHDAWARTAQLGVTYYTELPAMVWEGEPLHLPFEFDRRARVGVYTGQLLAGNAPSWPLWSRYGALTLERRRTPADWHRRAEEISAAFESGMQDRALARFIAAQPTQFPATKQLITTA